MARTLVYTSPARGHLYPVLGVALSSSSAAATRYTCGPSQQR